MSSGISSHASRRALDSSRDTSGTWLAGSSMHVSPKCNASQWGSGHARLELRGRAHCARIPRAKQSTTFDRTLESLWMRIIAKQFIALTHSGIQLEASRQFAVALFCLCNRIPTCANFQHGLVPSIEAGASCKCPQPDARPAELWPAGSSESILQPALLGCNVASPAIGPLIRHHDIRANRVQVSYKKKFFVSRSAKHPPWGSNPRTQS
jgi:hypothetical protein